MHLFLCYIPKGWQLSDCYFTRGSDSLRRSAQSDRSIAAGRSSCGISSPCAIHGKIRTVPLRRYVQEQLLQLLSDSLQRNNRQHRPAFASAICCRNPVGNPNLVQRSLIPISRAAAISTGAYSCSLSIDSRLTGPDNDSDARSCPALSKIGTATAAAPGSRSS